MSTQNPIVAEHYPEARFGGFTRSDGTIAFFARVNALLSPHALVLDVGCGRGEYADDPIAFRRDLRILRGKAARVIGLDPDPAAAANPFVDEFRRITGERWPVEAASVDLILADCVLEHVADPRAFFREAAGALRPGGVLCIRTTNTLGYVGAVARLVPNRLHWRVVARVQPDRGEQDVFPTVYRCNTPGRLRRALRAAGLQPSVWGHQCEPHYLPRLLYRVGVLYERLVPARFAPALFAFARKPQELAGR